MKACIFACALGISTIALFAQAPPKVEVASIKVHVFTPGSSTPPQIAANRLTRTGNLNQLVMYAYELANYQFSGGPGWVKQPSLDGDYYDINVLAEGSEVLTEPRARQLVQGLLTDRFQLKFHRETRDIPIYALVVSKGGPKFKESATEGPKHMTATAGQPSTTTTFTKSPINDLVRILSALADRPVFDETGLKGFYDFKLEFARDLAPEGAESNLTSLLTGLQEQLGLKLESRKQPTEVFVIDSVERPSEN